MKKLFRVSEIIITCLTLILLIYYSVFNYAAERNSESRIGDDEFFIKEVQRYFVVEIIVILMIIFILWRLIKPTKVLTTISRTIILFLAIFVPLCILLGFSYKIFHI
jgi:cell division protein FtsW (lipid II flippase)